MTVSVAEGSTVGELSTVSGVAVGVGSSVGVAVEVGIAGVAVTSGRTETARGVTGAMRVGMPRAGKKRVAPTATRPAPMSGMLRATSANKTSH